MIFRTTKSGSGRGSHSHMVYIRPDGTGVTTTDNKHQHEVQFIPEMKDYGPEQAFAILEYEGHSHQIVPVEEKEDDSQPKKNKESVEEVLTDLFEDQERESESIEAGENSEDMYCGIQWDSEIKDEVLAKKRAAHTINGIESRIDTLTGYQKQNRTDFKFYPTENGDAIVADILNIVVKNLTENCFYSREESKVFEDTAITGRGLFNVFEDYDKNVQGDIIVERFRWNECYFGPHDKEDLSDCDRLEKVKWFSKDKLKELYPDKIEELQTDFRQTESGGSTYSEDWDKRLNKLDMYDGRNYKMVEQWKKIYKRIFILVNSKDDFIYNAEDLTDSEINSIRKLDGFRKIPRVTNKIQVRKVISHTLLEDEYIEEEDFEIVPLYGKFRKNNFWGKVEGVKDLQHLLNKAYSQFSDIINKVANYGWFYDTDTFASTKDAKHFEQNASSPGFMSKLNNIAKPPVQVQGVKFPSELVNAISLFSGTMREIMNINLEMQGQSGEQSGIALRQKIVQQLLGNDFLFDNLSFAKKKIGQLIVKKIQKLYTPKRLLRIIANQAQKEEVELAGKPAMDYDPGELMKLLETEDLTKYDVIASESPSSPSAMMSNFLLMMELAGKGVSIPPQAILEFAPIPQKGKIMDMIAQAMKAQQDSEDKKYNTEIIKSQIAANSKAQVPGGGQMPQ